MYKVSHFELPAANMDRAAKFYAKVFGWKVNKWDTSYYLVSTAKTDKRGMIQEKGAINGGVYKRGAAKVPVIVLTVPSIRAVLKQVVRAGGRVAMRKVKIESMLYYARVRDSEGNIIGLAEIIKKGK